MTVARIITYDMPVINLKPIMSESNLKSRVLTGSPSQGPTLAAGLTAPAQAAGSLALAAAAALRLAPALLTDCSLRLPPEANLAGVRGQARPGPGPKPAIEEDVPSHHSRSHSFNLTISRQSQILSRVRGT